MTLSTEDQEELRALARVNDITKGPSFIMRTHWRTQYQRLVQKGLVIWGDPPAGFDRNRFAGTTITPLGRAAIAGCEVAT